MSDFHEATFTWPAGPSKVVVTGPFDGWSGSTILTKSNDGFSVVVKLPWNEKVPYKFIVDGQWTVAASEPTERDGSGNINNIYTSPTKPIVQEVKDTASDLADSALATKGAPTITSYVASGLGAAIASVTGYDPINPQQIPVEEAKTVSEPDATKAEPAPTVETVSDPIPVKAEAPVATDESKPLEAVSTSASAAVSQTTAAISDTVQKVQETVTSGTEAVTKSEVNGVVVDKAPEPYKEAKTDEPVLVVDAPEPYKEANGTLPAEKLEEAPPSATETTSASAASKDESTTTETKKDGPSAAAEEKKEETKDATPRASTTSPPRTSTQATTSPPTTPKKMRFPGRRSSEAHSLTGSESADSPNAKRKKRESFFGKIKHAFSGSPEKKKGSKVVSEAS
ncbi:SubName: Full=Uncharacterized protein {ECO:0000313/EMBL:CCA67999.1} [Serendipita indica DSM 11827]|uniref:AMP-activated protein kinase glycogen-binding domain-containing protein n=1 Tax=Serendipita indica (strain DSM 11827) TaxID=1109443 RepID=G4T9J1_SERID|nr:SubName: Full=Uncharacterized protein {ECO:0000313/EMBL:CCA67999.1} [Serendipita indica DSM 11827]CCA67999.1 hypothetical protein PIIN_01866 [Serendipita indica DSM 11827]